MRPIIVIFSSILLGFSGGAAAKDRQPEFEMHWVVGETEAMVEPVWVKKTEVVVETRLWPKKLYVADDAIQSADGKALFPEGGQLVQLAADRFTVCNIPKSANKKFMSAKKRVCLVDDDGDLTPDSWFARGSGGYWWFEISGDFDGKREALAEVSLTEADPKSMIGAPYMSFHYGRFLDRGNYFQTALDGGRSFAKGSEADSLVQFFFRIGKEKRREGMYRVCADETPPSMCADGNLPGEYRLMGLEIEMLERRKEDILLKVNKGFGGSIVKLFDTPDGYTSGELILVE